MKMATKSEGCTCGRSNDTFAADTQLQSVCGVHCGSGLGSGGDLVLLLAIGTSTSQALPFQANHVSVRERMLISLVGGEVIVQI